jgi:ribosomal protein S18 acetylase RimI-like enzyme
VGVTGEPTVRPLEERDADRAGDVNFLAFYDVALRHAQPPVVTTPAEARAYVRHLLAFAPLGGLVAERDGEIAGMAWVHVRGPVATIGPLAVDPRMQGQGIGRLLLERCVALAGPRAPQVRLVQESYNAASLGLYVRAGFRVVAPLIELELPAGGRLEAAAPTGVRLRPASAADRTQLVERDGRAFGAPRPQNVDLYLRRGRGLVAERGQALAGYAFGIALGPVAYLGSASAEDGGVLLELLAAQTAAVHGPATDVRVLVPSGDRLLVDGLLALGFRVLRACHYMVRGGGTAPPPNYVLMNGDLM